ncbi:flavodoxin-dependent (E)-4-hydroxy-3-methylbut-2-enyl-diphosphate synthase [bacterium]|nr:flavodoxin-dependent (E)-4-hydroxy-3-methylbut-2-enyl-diphosphate synthase [bacterium]
MSDCTVKIGDLVIGKGRPVAVQSMANTSTADVEATVKQILELARAGSELVRFTVKDEEDAKAVAHIRDRVREAGCRVPLIGDFHYNGHLLLSKYPDCLAALDKLRINPGNVGLGSSHDNNFKTMIELAIKSDKVVRIGVNGGSIDKELYAHLLEENRHQNTPKSDRDVFLHAMVESALQSAQKAEEYGLAADHIVVSAKISQVPDLLKVYRELGRRSKYVLHLGLTEAGQGVKGTVSSAVALGILLNEGIGDTIRVSLTPQPGQSRTQEVYVAQEILQSMGLRAFLPQVVSCPGCGRTSSTLFQSIALKVSEYLRERFPIWKDMGFRGIEDMKVAVMGCIVNGPGEGKDANIGLSLPGRGEDPKAIIFVDGQREGLVSGEDLANQFIARIEEYVKAHYQGGN